MTTPGGSAPDGAYVIGTRFGSDETEAGIRNKIKATTVTNFSKGQDNLWGSGGFLGFLTQGIFGFFGGVADFIGGMLGIRNSATNASMQVAEQAGSIEGLEVRVTALEGGGTRTVYSSNFTWSNPGSGTVGVAVFNGGQCGENGHFPSGSVALVGGRHGGYSYKELRCADLPATVAGTVGAGGSTNQQAGGQSSFGSYVVPISGGPGAILTKQGAVASNSTPGAGADSGTSASDPGYSGAPSALASGGAGGTTNGGDGQPGQSVPLESDTPCGGGGGGSGGGRNEAFTSPGAGGAGGAPGGGGGAGGRAGTINSAATSLPGPGANGRIILTFTPGAPS